MSVGPSTLTNLSKVSQCSPQATRNAAPLVARWQDAMQLSWRWSAQGFPTWDSYNRLCASALLQTRSKCFFEEYQCIVIMLYLPTGHWEFLWLDPTSGSSHHSLPCLARFLMLFHSGGLCGESNAPSIIFGGVSGSARNMKKESKVPARKNAKQNSCPKR